MKIELQEPWNESVVSEQADLKRKYIKLIEYINSERFYNLSDNEQKLLNNQKFLIEAYLKILNIKLYDDTNSTFIADLSWLSILSGVFNNIGNPLDMSSSFKEISNQQSESNYDK